MSAYKIPKAVRLADMPRGQHVMVECQRPDGSTSLHIGRYLGHDADWIVVDQHTWIADTGRRHQFLAGTPDNSLDAEPHPRDVQVRLPLWGAQIDDWMHGTEFKPK